jgi:hypothetical protein
LNKCLAKGKDALKTGMPFNPATQAPLNENLQKSLKNECSPRASKNKGFWGFQENLQKTLKNEGRTPSSKNKGFLMIAQTFLILADLENPGAVHEALQVVFDEYLPPAKTQEPVKPI